MKSSEESERGVGWLWSRGAYIELSNVYTKAHQKPEEPEYTTRLLQLLLGAKLVGVTTLLLSAVLGTGG